MQNLGIIDPFVLELWTQEASEWDLMPVLCSLVLTALYPFHQHKHPALLLLASRLLDYLISDQVLLVARSRTDERHGMSWVHRLAVILIVLGLY